MVSELNATSIFEIKDIYASQQIHFRQVGKTNTSERIAKLKKFQKVIFQFRKELQGAMWKDYHKPSAEVDLTEIYPVVSEKKLDAT